MSDSIMTFCANNNIEVLLNVSPATARSSFSTDADFIAAYLAQINPETVTPAQQAAYTIRMNMAAARCGINRVYHMSALDTDNVNSGWFGPDPNHDPRPVATAMRQVIRLLSGATYLEIVHDGGIASPGSPYAYRFSTPHGRVMVAWCQIPTNVTLPIDPSTQTVVTDMLGNTITTLRGGSYLASLSETPIFLHSSSET
jgi:hypothetical protein